MRRFRNTVMVLCGLMMPLAAQADSACWQKPELTAYDITMHTLLMAHIAAACDPVIKSDPPLKTQLGTFLSKNAAAMQAGRQPLNAYFQRAYGTDWEMPLKQSLAREDKRVTDKVGQNVTPESCADGAGLIGGLSNASWDSYVADAVAHGWDQQAGFPACK